MAINDVDFSKVGPRLLPPDKRFPNIRAWLSALLKPLQWLRDLFLGEYFSGSTAQEWLDTTTYAKYDRVIYTIYVYESLVNGNTAVPTDSSKWQIVQQTFIGLNERLSYNTQVLLLTKALNKEYKTVFRQPNDQSDIYIVGHSKPPSVFVIGGSEANSSSIARRTSSEYIVNAYFFGDFVNMSIHVPVAVYNALDPLPINCDKIIRSFVDKYIAAGITYEIITY